LGPGGDTTDHETKRVVGVEVISRKEVVVAGGYSNGFIAVYAR
jgi:hypothetical protein